MSRLVKGSISAFIDTFALAFLGCASVIVGFRAGRGRAGVGGVVWAEMRRPLERRGLAEDSAPIVHELDRPARVLLRRQARLAAAGPAFKRDAPGVSVDADDAVAGHAVVEVGGLAA